MQNPEKKSNYKHVDLDETKKRVFNRFFTEHGLLDDRVLNHHSDYRVTPKEMGGIISKIILFNEELMYFEVADNLYQLNAELLLMAGQINDDEDYRKKLLCFSDTIVPLIRLFDWLDSYGPSKI